MKFQRRSILAAISALFASLAAGCATVRPRSDIVLVHGAWHGAWCWERVTPMLLRAGYTVHTPTLPGQGERAAELNESIDLKSHIAEIVNFIEMKGLKDVILVGHSYAGIVITGVADQIPGRLHRLIYLDALILDSGESVASLSGRGWEARMKSVKEDGRNLGLPALPPAAFGVLQPKDQAWLAQRLTLQPVHTFDQPLMLRNPFGNGVSKVYIDCNQPAMASVNAFKAKVRKQSGWAAYETFASGHDAMIIEPNGLAELLLRHSS